MDPLSTVRTEIKSWERSFKSEHGRNPTIQDIKLVSSIADKYRLYKKLSKSAGPSAPSPAPSASAQATSGPPFTPPRGQASSRIPHLLLSDTRRIETTAPLSTFNPFSPQKNKGKQREVPIVTAQSHSNPFGSPVKVKSHSKTQSSHPTSSIHDVKPSRPALSPKPSPPAPTSAVSRARKRLRGEPVSPSPNKDKRRRVGSQSTMSFPSILTEKSSGDDEDDDINLSFVSDSPMKAPTAGSKSFKLLFDDSNPRQTTDTSLGPTKSVSRGLFRGRSNPVHSDEDVEWGLDENTGRRMKGTIANNGKRPTKHISNRPANQMQKPTRHATAASMSTTLSEIRTSAKRSQPDTDTEQDVSNEPPARALSLLPPSPPPPDSTAHYTKQGNKKSRTNPTTRKKPKISNEDDNEDGEDEEDDELNDLRTSVKIVNRTQPQVERGSNAAGGGNDLDFDPDPILGRAVPRGYVSSQGAEPDTGQDDGQFEVDLPDKLRQVLALESSKTRDSQSERMVKSLLYGRRAGNYDPVKGGEIWDVGEDERRHDEEEGTRRDTEGEDDWEGEPVPWEVGEL